MTMRSRILGQTAATVAVLGLLTLAGCDRPSAVETRERASDDAPLALASMPEATNTQAAEPARPKPWPAPVG